MAKDEKSVEKSTDNPLSLIDSFFPQITPKGKEDTPALAKVANVLLRQGISSSHLRETLAVIIGIMSTRLGDPVPMVITEDEGAGAVEFLATCLNLVPEESWVDGSVGSKKGFDNDMLTSGKTIICYDGDQLKNELTRTLTAAERGHLVNSKKSAEPHPPSFVAILRDPNNPILKNRYVTRIHFSADEESKKIRMKSMAKKSGTNPLKNLQIESACVKTLLKRVKDNSVDIEFADKIMSDSAVMLQNAVPLYDLSLRIIRNITRITNAPPLGPYENQVAFIGLDYDQIFPPEHGSDSDRLLATKIEYYYFLMIFGEFLRSGNDFLSPRQARVFGQILTYNMQGMQKYRNKYPTDEEILSHMHNSAVARVWIRREDLFSTLLSTGVEHFSKATLHNELQELLRRELITRRRVMHSRYRYEYAVNQVPNDEMIFNTDFNQIIDSKYKKSKAEVTNIFTGKVEKI